MKDLLKNFFIFGFAIMTERLLSFLLLPLYARVFSVEEFGSVDLIQTFVSITSIFALLQLETSLQRYYYQYKNVRKKLFSSTIYLSVLILASIITALLCLSHKLIGNWLLESSKYSTSVIIASLQIPFSVPTTILLLILRFEKQNKLFTGLILLKVILLFALTFYFLHWLELGVIGLFYAQLIVNIVISMGALYMAKKYLIFKLSTLSLKTALAYALPQFPARMGSTASTYANRFFIVGYLNVFMVGVFSMALRIASVIQIIHQVFMMAWNQFMFEAITKANHKQLFLKVYKIMVPVVFGAVIALTLLSKEIVVNFTTIEYIQSYKYIGIIALSIALLICKEVIDIGPKIENKTIVLTKNFIISTVIHIGLMFLLTPYLNILGVVLSMLIGNLSLLIVSWYNSNKLHYIPFGKLYFLLNFMLVCGVVFLNVYLDLSLHSRVLLFIGAVTVYGSEIYYSIFKLNK